MKHECTHFFCGPAACAYDHSKEPAMGTNRPSTEGLDHKIDPNDISYLKEGDRIRLTRKTGRVEILYATADMDGHAVSESYGHCVGSHHYDDIERNYINVKFDHVTYTKAAPKPNDGLLARGPFHIYVTTDVVRRINQVKAGKVSAEKAAKRSELEQKLVNAEAIIASVRAEMKTLGL